MINLGDNLGANNACFCQSVGYSEVRGKREKHLIHNDLSTKKVTMNTGLALR